MGDYIMASKPGQVLYSKCLVTGFDHSGIYLIHDGRWTFQWPDGSEETRRCNGGASDLQKVCPRCQGEREIKPNDRDLLIEGGVLLFVSGTGSVRAGQGEDGQWWKHTWPNISKSDLLTLEGIVYSVSESRWEDTYQVFSLEDRGSTDVSDHIMNECSQHGWHIEDRCPECS